MLHEIHQNQGVSSEAGAELEDMTKNIDLRKFRQTIGEKESNRDNL